MRKIYYQDSCEIQDGVFLHINYFNGAIVILDHEGHEFYENIPNSSVEQYQDLWDSLKRMDFIVEDDYNEKDIVQFRRSTELYDKSLYHLIVNPTLDCNLSCWYCYERRYKGSKISKEVSDGIIKHIIWKCNNEPFSTLKLSFFGGEPFYNYPAIKDIIERAKNVCIKRGISLYLDFTTNGTLLDAKNIDFLSDLSCQFQITIDGNKEQHNKVKHTKDRSKDLFTLTFQNMKLIQEKIPSSMLFLRINFDENTLESFDEILARIKELDRRRTVIIVKRVWQVNHENINNEIVNSTIEKLNGEGFSVDYYTQGKLCFGERYNEAVINYDGQVFKCTTISDFNQTNAYGKLDTQTGQIIWNESKLAYDYSTKSPDECLSCRRFPSCYGPCPNQIKVGHTECYLKSLNISKQEYFRYLVTNKLKRE